MAGHPLCLVLSAKSVKSVVNSVFDSGSAALRTGAPYLSRPQRSSGGVLIVTLLLASILGFTLGSYLYWVRTQNLLVAESQTWNSALALAEAGIEEGMAQINVNVGGDPTVVSNYVPSAVTNFGSLSGGAYGPKTNSTLSSGSYSVTITPPPQGSDPTNGPTISAVGYTTLPIVGRPIARKVQVTTTIKSLLANTITVLNNIDFAGMNVTIDSYNSTDPNHNTNGMYDAATRMAGGDVASLFGIISVQNAKIYGHLETGATDPNAPTYGTQGSVGDIPWVAGGNVGIKQGWWLNDFNMDVPDIQPPYTTGWSLPAGTGTNKYIIGSGDYILSGDLNLGNSETLYVSGSPARLYVTGNIKMQSQNSSFITLATGASLEIFVGTVSGPAVDATFTTINNSGNDSLFKIFGLPSLKTMSFNGNASFSGVVYAPEAYFNLSGGAGNKNLDFQGAITVGSMKINGNFTLHYDENLKKYGPASGYTVTSWRELAAQ